MKMVCTSRPMSYKCIISLFQKKMVKTEAETYFVVNY